MANRKSSLTASNIRYLIAIRKLCEDGNGTRCVRIAEVLGVSKPSVHTMINSLKELDLVRKDRYGEVFSRKKAVVSQTFTQSIMRPSEDG